MMSTEEALKFLHEEGVKEETVKTILRGAYDAGYNALCDKIVKFIDEFEKGVPAGPEEMEDRP